MTTSPDSPQPAQTTGHAAALRTISADCIDADLPVMIPVYTHLLGEADDLPFHLDADAVFADHESITMAGIDPASDVAGAAVIVQENIDANA
jgi:hypothetical protein